jgi:taurine dioxygenase
MSLAQAFEITPPTKSTIGADVVGIDLNEVDAGSPEIKQLQAAIYQYKLIVVRGQKLSEQQYVDFARKMGRPQVYFQANYHHPLHDEIFVSSNVIEADGKRMGVSGTGAYWHTDCAFETHPLSLTTIYPVVFTPQERGTHYTDMVEIYKNLPAHLKAQVDGKTAIHAGQLRYKVQESDIDKSLLELLERINREVPPVKHPAVIEHPITGEKALYLNSGFTVAIEGLTYEENKKVLDELFEYIERPEHVFTHWWSEGDLVMWDNRTLNHMSTKPKPGSLSKSYRIGIYDNVPFYKGIAE